MGTGLLGRKVGMTRVFDEDGNSRGVTVVQVGPCTVVDVRTEERNGYRAVVVGFDAVNADRLTKPMRGVFQVQGVDAFRHLAEFAWDGDELPEVGTQLNAETFTAGDKVDVRGRTKGKGFAGVHKRHGFRGGRASHGSNFHRAPGSIGNASDPGRVDKGKKMPGQYGNVNKMVRNLSVVDVLTEDNLILVDGSVPGARNSVVRVTKAG